MAMTPNERANTMKHASIAFATLVTPTAPSEWRLTGRVGGCQAGRATAGRATAKSLRPGTATSNGDGASGWMQRVLLSDRSLQRAGRLTGRAPSGADWRRARQPAGRTLAVGRRSGLAERQRSAGRDYAVSSDDFPIPSAVVPGSGAGAGAAGVPPPGPPRFGPSPSMILNSVDQRNRAGIHPWNRQVMKKT